VVMTSPGDLTGLCISLPVYQLVWILLSNHIKRV